MAGQRLCQEAAAIVVLNLIARVYPLPLGAARCALAHARCARAILERDLRLSPPLRVRADVRPSATRGTALLASLTYSTFQLKLEGMLAKAFQLQGLEPVAAVPADGAICRPLPRGVRRRAVRRLEDYLTPELEDEARREGEALLEGVRSRTTCSDSRSAASTSAGRRSRRSRAICTKAVSTSPTPRRASCSAASCRRRCGPRSRSSGCSTTSQPELVLFNERNYADQGPLCDLALERGLNVVQFVSGFEDDTLVFKRFTAETKAIHPRSLADESWARVRALPWAERQERELDEDFSRRYDGSTFLARLNQGWTRPRTRGEVVAELGLDPSRKTAVVFSHVLWDANMFYGRDLFADQEEWFVETVRAAARTTASTGSSSCTRRTSGSAGATASPTSSTSWSRSAKQVGELPPHVRVLEPTATSARGRSSTSPTSASRSAARSGSSCRASACRC